MSIVRRFLLLASEFMDQYADRLGNDGCNDYELDDTPETRELMEMMHKWNCPDEDEVFDPEFQCRDGKIHTSNSFVAAFLAHLLKEAGS